MSKKLDSNLIVGLDMGTSKVVVIVAEVSPSDEVEIIGLGHQPAKGMKKGVVADIESTVKSIQRAVEEAELMAGCQIYSVFVGIAGAHINSFNSLGVVGIKNKEVDKDDVSRVLHAASAQAIPSDQRVLHVLPQDYRIDGQEGIKEPLGMSGVRLEANVHVITGAVSAAQNITKCVHRVGLEVDDITLEPVASSYAVLNDDERDLGVCMVDIGGGTTDIAVIIDGSIRHTAVIPIAGDQVTKDISIALKTPVPAAEEIKKRYGCALAKLASPDEEIETPSIGDRPSRRLSRQELAQVIEPRVEELLNLIKYELRRSGYEELISSGVVLTGGASTMEGMVELAEDIFEMPVRIGMPKYEGKINEMVRNPIYATGIGLILFGHKQFSMNSKAKNKKGFNGSFNAVWQKMKNMFSNSF